MKLICCQSRLIKWFKINTTSKFWKSGFLQTAKGRRRRRWAQPPSSFQERRWFVKLVRQFALENLDLEALACLEKEKGRTEENVSMVWFGELRSQVALITYSAAAGQWTRNALSQTYLLTWIPYVSVDHIHVVYSAGFVVLFFGAVLSQHKLIWEGNAWFGYCMFSGRGSFHCALGFFLHGESSMRLAIDNM